MSCRECHKGAPEDVAEAHAAADRTKADPFLEEVQVAAPSAETTDPLDQVRTSIESVRGELGEKIAALEQKVFALEVLSGQTMANTERLLSRASWEKDEAKDEAFYEWTMSMWDAGLLLFLHRNTAFDRGVLVLGVLLNLGLQALVFFVIVYNMLDNDYNESTIAEMVRWRVTYGHSNGEFDAARGESLAGRLCKQELWSFEGQEYEEMYSYLYRHIPGAVLSVLAIILWVLATMAEYRKCVNQFLSLLNLPVTGLRERSIVDSRTGELAVVGISRLSRLAAFSCLVIPRLVVALALMVVGCKYLAQTITLSDIVLNTVALAFVMDIDEHIASVLLTERLQFMVGKVQPMSCGKPRTSCANLRDGIRYALIAAMILFSVAYWVIPFVSNVDAAATALCGGNLDFSYSGGTKIDPDITIMPRSAIFDEYQVTCPASRNQTYQQFYYPEYTPRNQSTPEPQEGGGGGGGAGPLRGAEEELSLQVLRYAFSTDGCPPGMIRTPPRNAELMARGFSQMIFDGQVSRRDQRARGGSSTILDGTCAATPATLGLALPEGVYPGADEVPADCARFDVSLRGDACAEPEHPGVCVWSWEAQACEGMVFPGVFFQSACRSDLWLTCDTWENAFGVSHPIKNCLILEYCTRETPRCLRMDGWFDVIVEDVSALRGRRSEVLELVRDAVETAVNLPDPWRYATYYIVFTSGARGRHDLPGHADNHTVATDNHTTATTTTTTTMAACIDIDMDDVDQYGDNCEWYSRNDNDYACGSYKTETFNSLDMCCVCGGGIDRERYVAACADDGEGKDCVHVFYRFSSMGEELSPGMVLEANDTIFALLRPALANGTVWGSEVAASRLVFDEGSVRLSSS